MTPVTSTLPAEAAPRRPVYRRHGVQAVAKTVGSRLGWIVLNALTGMITARALGTSGRGALAAMIMWPVFLAGVLTFGLPSALIFRLRQAQGRERTSLFTAATILAAGVGLLATAGGVFLLPFWLSRYSPQVVRWTQWLMLFTVVSMLMLIFRAAFEAMGNFGRSASSWVVPPVQTLVSLLLLWRIHRLNELTAALSYVLAGVPILLWMLVRLSRELGWSLHGFRQSARDLLGYGLRSYGIDLCGMLAQSVDQALVVGMISASEMGLYVVALSLSRTLNAVYVAAAAVLFPKCIGLPRRRSFEVTVGITAASAAVTLPGALVLGFFGSSLLHLFYGSEYVVATLLLRILIAEAMISGMVTLMSQPFMAWGRPGTVTVLQAMGLAAAIPLLLVLVPRFGIQGAGLALLCSAALRLLLLLLLYLREVRRRPRWDDLTSVVRALAPGQWRRTLVTTPEPLP